MSRPESFPATMRDAADLLKRGNEHIYYCRELGPDGHSPFVAVLTVAALEVAQGSDERCIASAVYNENVEYPEARAALIVKLREVLRDLEAVTVAQSQVAS